MHAWPLTHPEKQPFPHSTWAAGGGHPHRHIRGWRRQRGGLVQHGGALRQVSCCLASGRAVWRSVWRGWWVQQAGGAWGGVWMFGCSLACLPGWPAAPPRPPPRLLAGPALQVPGRRRRVAAVGGHECGARQPGGGGVGRGPALRLWRRQAQGAVQRGGVVSGASVLTPSAAGGRVHIPSAH